MRNNIKRFFKKVILFLINLIEKYQFRNLDLDQNDNNKKIINESDINIDVLSDSGYVNAFKYLETQPYDVWFLELENGDYLDCADIHIVYDEHLNERLVKDLLIGDFIMTKTGASKVSYIKNTKIPVSMVDLSIDHPNHRYYTNNILSHNSITSAIILLWYLLFNHDKNAMILANIGDTAEELIDKIKSMVKGLPFYLKPGMFVNNVMSMRFDNGCRVQAKTTTKTTGIGFTIHFLYMDEFAHINESFMESFFKSTYPTVSASKVSRVIITSTPNGRNKFYDIYNDALLGLNKFNPIRVDWWQVPGRDEEWKASEIATLGSEEAFNQEYGNQFLSSDTLLIGSNELNKMKNNESEYTWREIDALEDLGISYEHFKWHLKFKLEGDVLLNNKYVFSIDLAGGGKGDYTVINIFKVVPLPKKVIQEMIDFTDESDFFGLLQVGLFRSNETEIEDTKKILEALILNIFDVENLRILLEMNYKGDLLHDKMLMNDDIPPEIFVHTKHTEAARDKKPGIKYGNDKIKLRYCEILRSKTRANKVILNEKKYTVPEMFAFGMNGRGTYSSQSGHDDIAMSTVNTSALFESVDLYDLVSDIYDNLSEEYRELIESKLNEGAQGDTISKEGGFYEGFSKLL